jgi:TonB-linked SusC/RagA family outer membrane protein
MEKNVYNTHRVRNKRTLKFLIMSKCILLLVIISFQSFSKGYSQDKINIKLNDVSLRTAFKEIEKKTGYRFLYNDALFKGINNKVSVQFTDATINQITSNLLSDTKLTYQITSNNLVILKSKDAIAIPIRGKVTDSKGSPLVGVTISEKNANNNTVSDIDGNFRLSVTDGNAVLVLSYIGYGTEEVTVGTQTNFSITLTETAANLNEVVVVGYGTQKKVSVTAAISSVKGAELVQAPVPNISNSILGRVSGVVGRQSNGGRPGSAGNSDLQVRGVNTRGNNSPIIVVDNVRRDNINQVDPNSIESVSILKDAAATAPYGLGGANGVILITTKQGKTGAPTISLSSYYGIQNSTYLPNVLNAEDYMRLVNEAYINGGGNPATPIHSAAKIDSWDANSKIDPDRYPRNNPTDILLKNAPMQNHNVQVSGGTDRLKYYSNLGFFYQEGSFPQINYSRYSYNLNLEAKVTNTTTFQISINGTSEIDRGLDPGHQPTNLLRSTYKYIPTDPYKFSNGLWGASNGLSPYATLQAGGYTKGNFDQQLMSVSVNQKLPIKGLSIKGVVSYDPFNQYRKLYHKPFYYYTVNYNTTPYTYSKAASTSEGLVNYISLREEFNRGKNFTYQGYLNYAGSFGKHEISGLIVAEARNNKSNNFNAQINNYALDIDELAFGSSNRNDYSIGGNSSTGSQLGYVYRVGDTYDNKYTIEATGRYDGHYAFAPGKRYAYFPAFSAGWILSNENFMKKFTWINLLKLRGSWGQTGNLVQGSAFQWQDSYGLANNSYAFGNGVTVQGSFPNAQANSQLTWEIATKTDIGIDASLFNGKLNLEVGVYKQRRSNMLVDPQTVVSREYGIGLSQVNGGDMESSGIEITAGTQHRFSNGLQLTLNGNFTYANNKLLQIYESAATFNNPNRRRTGRQNNAQFGYKSEGLFHLSDDKNGDGVINTADGYNIATTFGTIKPGNVRYSDISGPNGVPDGKIDINDETFIGYNPLPLITYGFTLGANWKGFDLSAFFQGAAKSTIGVRNFLTEPFNNNSSNTSYEYYNNRWTPATDMTAKYPRASAAPYTNDTQGSDFWLRDASYLRLRTATLGYTIPSSVVRALKIKSVRLYVTGQNLLTFSKLKFTDPELAGGTGIAQGQDTAWPIQKTWTFGLNATF